MNSPCRSAEKTAIGDGAASVLALESVGALANGACWSELRCGVVIRTFGKMVTQAGPLDREACYARRNEGNAPIVGYQSFAGRGESEIVYWRFLVDYRP